MNAVGHQQNIPMNRGQYLQMARNKYFWHDASMPSFRLQEDQDDNGNTIEEEELFRPVGMDDFEYAKKIEVSCHLFFYLSFTCFSGVLV